jgi:hypothetical protein
MLLDEKGARKRSRSSDRRHMLRLKRGEQACPSFVYPYGG